MNDSGLALAVAGALLVLSVVASKASVRFGVPALLLFLAIGMLAGSEGVGGIEFADYERAQFVGVVALAFILFSGGLDTDWHDVRAVAREGVLLATIGVLVTAVVAGLFATVVLHVEWKAGLLLGAIISSTDAAAVFAVLRSRNVSLRGRLRPLLEFESGSNDPMAVFLTVALLTMLTEPGTEVVDVLPTFVAQLAIGGLAGYVLARGAVFAVNRVPLEYEGLYPVVLIAVVTLTYGTTAVLGGSGFLAVYVAGIVMGNSSFLHKKSLVRFTDGVAWLMQIAMFLVLGLLVFPSDLAPVAPRALLISAVLIVVARPVAVMTILGLARFGVRESLMVSWVGLRGAVPIVLATFALVEGIPEAKLIFDVVFFIVLTSVLVQGTTIPFVARRLRVDAPLPPRQRAPLEFVEPIAGATDVHQLVVARDAPAAGAQLVDLKLPPGTLVVLLTRGDEAAVPQGSTVLRPGDVVLLLASDESLAHVRRLVEGAARPGA